MRLVTPDGTFTYRVEGTQVVEPRDMWVLDPTERARADAGDLLSVPLRRLRAAALHRARLASPSAETAPERLRYNRD